VQSGSGKHWTHLHSAYAYAHSQGLFAGISLEGSVVTVRKDVNAKFYGKTAPAADLLQYPGSVVTAAQPLYAALDRALQIEIPKHAFRPSQLWQSTSQSNNMGASNDASLTAAQAVANAHMEYNGNGMSNHHQQQKQQQYYHS